MYAKKYLYKKREKTSLFWAHINVFQDKQKIWSRDAMTCKYKDEKSFFFKPKEMLFKHWIFSQLMHRFIFKDDIEISRSYQFHQIFSEVTNLKEMHSASAEKKIYVHKYIEHLLTIAS